MLLRSIFDICLLEDLEYFVQLSFFTADLHITRAWRLVSEADEENHKILAKELSGSITNSLLELSQIIPPVSFDTILTTNTLTPIDATKMIFPLGGLAAPPNFRLNPTGIYRFILFDIALGLASRYVEKKLKDSVGFQNASIPQASSSLIKVPNEDSSKLPREFCLEARVRSSQQALPSILIEIEFKPLRIEAFVPVCEYCQSVDADIYCPADKIHLCNVCDLAQHSGDRLLSKHCRVPSSESPAMFGPCQTHPSENINAVCLTCFVPLCSQCVLIGSHGVIETTEHQIVSTVEALKFALKSVGDHHQALDNTSFRHQSVFRNENQSHDLNADMTGLLDTGAEQHLMNKLNFVSDRLTELLTHSDVLKSRVDSVAQKLFGHYTAIRNRRLQLCEALERQFLLEIFQVEWADEFLKHLRAALSPSDFLFFKHRHDLLAEALFKPAEAISALRIQSLPYWMLQHVRLTGLLKIGPVQASTGKILQTILPQQRHDILSSGLALNKLYFIPNDNNNDKKNSITTTNDQSGPKINIDWVPFSNDIDSIDINGIVSQDTKARIFDPDEIDLVLPEENQKPYQEKISAVPLRNTTNKEYKPAAAPPDPTDVLLNTYYYPLIETQDKLASTEVTVTMKPNIPHAINVPLSTSHLKEYHPTSVVENTLQGKGLIQEKPEVFPFNQASSQTTTAIPIISETYNNPPDAPLNSSVSITTQLKKYTETGNQDTADNTIKKTFDPLLLAIKKNKNISCEEFWKLLKDFEYEALLMLLNTCPKPSTSDLIRYVCNFANYMEDLENVINVIIKVDTLLLSKLAPELVSKYPSLIPPIVSHIFASNEILRKNDRSFFEFLIQPVLQELHAAIVVPLNVDKDQSTMNAVTLIKNNNKIFEDAIESLVSRIIQIPLDKIPQTIRALLYTVADAAANLSVARYPANILGIFSNDDKLRQTSVGTFVAANGVMPPISPSAGCCVEAFLRLGLAEYIARRTLLWNLNINKKNFLTSNIDLPIEQTTKKIDYREGSIYKNTTCCFALSILLKQISGAVWRVAENMEPRYRFGAGAMMAVGSNDEEEFFQRQAHRLYIWTRDVVLSESRLRSGYMTDWTRMPSLGIQSALHLADYIVALDGSIRQGTYKLEWPGIPEFTTNDLIIGTRNYDILVLAAMTLTERRMPLVR